MIFDLNSYMLFLYACCRMAGVVFLNPIFGRQNIPNMVKVGLSLGIALYAANGLNGLYVMDYSSIDIIVTMLKEFIVGFTIGFVIHIFLGIFHMGGELIDLQMGISMASMYDPSSNSQISITGNILTIMYIMLFFISNCHISLLAVAMKSYDAVPLGFQFTGNAAAVYFIRLFGEMLHYAVRVALPFFVMEILVEAAVGTLMRVVSNINVFVINLQVKLLVGLMVLITIIPILVKYLETLNSIMMQSVQDVLMYIT